MFDSSQKAELPPKKNMMEECEAILFCINIGALLNKVSLFITLIWPPGIVCGTSAFLILHTRRTWIRPNPPRL